jgi:hypothetical protein
MAHTPSFSTQLHFRAPNWRLLAQCHPNLLICAATPLAIAIVTALSLGLRQPVQIQGAWSRASAPTSGTLVLHGVDRLDPREQRELFAWLDATHETVQVVSLSTRPIFPLVTQGLFLDPLYYRLNTIFVDTEAPEAD